MAQIARQGVKDMAKTSFRGSKRYDAGFSLFGTLCLICALSLIGAGMCSIASARHKAVKKSAAQFYRTLEAQNERVRAQIVLPQVTGGAGDAYAVD